MTFLGTEKSNVIKIVVLLDTAKIIMFWDYSGLRNDIETYFFH